MNIRIIAAAAAATLAFGAATAVQADTFVLTNTTHPELYGIAPPALVDGNGTGSATDSGGALTGPNNGGLYHPDSNTTRLTATSLTNELLTFTWNYHTNDTIDASFDPAGYFINGIQTQLTVAQPVFGPLGRNQNGVFSISLNAGDSYGFYVFSTDSAEGAGMITWTTSRAAVPEPATWAMLITGFGMIGLGLRRRSLVACAPERA